MRMLPSLPGLALAAAVLLSPAPLAGQTERTPLQDYRQTLMEGLDAHNGAVRAIVGGELGYASHLLDHARAIAALSQMLPDVFPEGSQEGTRAEAAIWEDWDDFMAKVTVFQEAAQTLVSAVEGGDDEAVLEAAGGVGRACRSCHQPYRARRGS